ncbi:MAG: aminoacyl--tRNA ligase-related protein [Candidatus Paceibacterota bacterium]
MQLYSELFSKTRKEAPKDEVSRNAQLLIRAGFINKEMAGVYSYLPLGLRVLRKIENIIREEMNALGGQEILMTTLQDSSVWKKSGRWSESVVDNWFKTKLVNNGEELGIANTHEEPLTQLLTNHVRSHNDLPLYIYQIQTKFRNELRAKSGLMRGREFLMKDLYSFSENEEDFREFYEKCAESYLSIFKRVGLGEVVFRTFASGGSFSKFSDEFQALSDAGEDIIYVDDTKRIAVNKEVYTPEVLSSLSLSKESLQEKKAIEVGNIFPLGTRYAEVIGLSYLDDAGKRQHPYMGSYGIGLGRLMGAVVEILSDDKGIVWPEEIAPYEYHLIVLGEGEVEKRAMRIADELEKKGASVLIDERNVSGGVKFSDADLIGIPHQLIVGEKTLEKEGFVECKERKSNKISMVEVNTLYE